MKKSRRLRMLRKNRSYKRSRARISFIKLRHRWIREREVEHGCI